MSGPIPLLPLYALVAWVGGKLFLFFIFYFFSLSLCISTQNVKDVMGKKETVAVGINLLKPTGYVMHQQFNIQQLYALPTLYLCVLYLSENKQRLVPLTA